MNAKAISLKTKIMLSTLIPVIVSFILIGIIVFPSLVHLLSESARSSFVQISQKHAHIFEGKITDAINYLSFLSSELEARIDEGVTDREALARTVLKVFDDYGVIAGSSVCFEPDMFDGNDADFIGSAYGAAESGRICWYFIMEDGNAAFLPDDLHGDAALAMPHYLETKNLNKPIYTDPKLLNVDGEMVSMFTIAFPINNAEGEFIGSVTADLFLDDIYSMLESEKIYDTGYMMIANEKEMIIYSPHEGDIGGTRKDAGLIYSLPSGANSSTFINAKSILNGKDSLVALESIYIPRLGSTFYVSVTAPMSEINAEVTQLIVLLFALSVLVVAAIGVLLYYLIHRISAPLNEITDSLDRIAGGEYNARIEGEYTGEFAVVKDSVNTMADRIEAYTEDSERSINILKSILNGLDAYIYVTNPDTGEILFINDNMKELYELTGEGVGQVCYQVLQDGFTERCDFCPCIKLDKAPDSVVVWEEHSTVTKRNYRNTDRYIDWIGGVKAHLQHSVDITDIKQAQITLDRRLGQQALMTAISQSFLSDEDVDTLITNALRMTGEFMGVSQVLLYEMQPDDITLTCKNEWINPQLDLSTRLGGKLMLGGSILSVVKGLTAEKEFCLNSNDPMLKAAMAPYRENFQNYIATPIFVKNKLFAVLDFSREDDSGDWSESDINLAVLVSSLLSGVFDRSNMEGQLRRLSSIVESSPQFIMYLTAEGAVDYLNPAAETITGYSEEELMRRGLDTIFDEQTVQAIKEEHIPATIRDGTDNFEIELICKDGRKRIMAFSSFTTGPGSANVGGIASDVTEIRRLQAELIAARDLAEQGSRSKSEFLSRMSHEMRTPMNAIIGMTNIAKSSSEPEKKEYCLDRIDNASRHLLGVINDILDMSKIEANKFDLSFTEFGFDRMLRGVLDVINFKIDEKHQKFTLYIDPVIPAALVGDEQRLAQVITNLLSNAVKFTPEKGEIQLKAFVAEEEGESLTLRVEVIDSGIGISAEQQAKLFRSFEQANGSIARKFGGTGLGLAISKRIVELMGGSVWVESELGEGSKFIFTFKAKRGKYNAVEVLKKHVNINELNIMAVDDSSEVREYFRHVLDKAGAPCVVASDGEEALKLFQSSQKPFDIVFIDWKMPIMNGIELTKELRRVRGAEPIIIMISVAEWSDIEGEAVQAGVNGFIPKPLFPSLLLDCITRHIGAVVSDDPDNMEELSPSSFEGKTALLAEDVDINREIILTVLDESKLQIECAENGREAVELFTANPDKYDIILMDVHMPEVDGLEATRRIRKVEASGGTPRVPIVAMTANVFREDVEACLNAGMDDHIGKPIDFDELFSKLNKHLNNH